VGGEDHRGVSLPFPGLVTIAMHGHAQPDRLKRDVLLAPGFDCHVATLMYNVTTMKSTSKAVGIRELKNNTSSVLRRVRTGETITVTDRDVAIAMLVPLQGRSPEELVTEFVKCGQLSWNERKPMGLQNPPRVKGAPVADAVIEDRR
jgi:prevent-host-death family protein